MSITVAEALKIGALRKCKLLAGSRNVDNIINFVDSMEVPDITPWLQSNELLVTTGYSIKDDREALVRLIESLKQVKAAGLAIKARFVGQIPEDIIKLADDLDLPLIEIPEDVPFIQITHPLMKAIASRQTMNLEFSETVHRELTKVELDGKGFEDIAKTLHNLINNVIIITDKFLRILAISDPTFLNKIPTETVVGKETIYRIKIPYQKRINMQGTSGTGLLEIDGSRWSYRYRSARARDKVYGYLLAVEMEKQLKDLELIALEHATTTTCLEFVKQELVTEQIKMVEHDFFSDLLLGSMHDEPEAQHRVNMLGWPQPPWHMAVIDTDDFTSYISLMEESAVQALKDEIRDVMMYALLEIQGSYVILSKSDSFIFLFSDRILNDKETIEKTIREAMKRAKEELGVSLSCGISGQIKDVMGIKVGHKEARTALKITRLVNGLGSIGRFERLALERALLDLSGNEPFKEYYESILGGVERYDKQNQGELMKTLRALVNNMGIRNKAAEQLFIHRNTLTYRIKQIEKLTNLDLLRTGDIATIAILLKVKPFV